MSSPHLNRHRWRRDSSGLWKSDCVEIRRRSGMGSCRVVRFRALGQPGDSFHEEQSMATGLSAYPTRQSSPPSAARAWLRPKYGLFGFIGLLLLYVLQHNERFLIDFKDDYWNHIETLGLKWWLLPHGLAGACALLLGPMQFSDRLRGRYTWLHRAVGRVYVAATFIAAPLGVYLEYLDEAGGSMR